MKSFIVLAFLPLIFVVHAGVSMHNPFYCYSLDPIRPLTRMGSTETAYEAVYRPWIDPEILSRTPSRIWILFRHGGQIANTGPLRDMLSLAHSTTQADIADNYEAGRTTLCRKDYELLQNWTIDPNLTIDSAALPTEGNRVGMRNIARRLQKYFPSLLTESYSPDRFHFRHVSSLTTNVSIRAFASGLFGDQGAENVIYEDVPAFDWFLLPIGVCPALTNETAGQQQMNAFRNGPEFEKMMEEVNRKLGFHGSNQLSIDWVVAMSEFCRRETMEQFALDNPEADIAWCTPFSMAHFLLLEYFTDLRYYYTAGYGVRNQRLVENLNCGLVQDLLTLMKSNNHADKPVRVFVTHSSVLHALMVTFGVFRDRWLLDQYNFAQKSARQWFTSLLTPSAGNLIVVRYDRTDGDHDLLFLLNEQPLLIDGCGTKNGICKLSFLLARFKRFLDVNCEKVFCSDE